MTTPELPEGPQPAPFTPLPPSPGPACSTCGNKPIAQWRRRPTTDELATLVAAEEARRTQALLLADPQQPPPVFPPLPTADDTTMAVYGCAEHAIHIDAAARIHEATCTGCDCDPEPLPPPTPIPGEEPTITLPTGWTIPAPTEENA
jgi:hypothetical protein